MATIGDFIETAKAKPQPDKRKFGASWTIEYKAKHADARCPHRDENFLYFHTMCASEGCLRPIVACVQCMDKETEIFPFCCQRHGGSDAIGDDGYFPRDVTYLSLHEYRLDSTNDLTKFSFRMCGGPYGWAQLHHATICRPPGETRIKTTHEERKNVE